MLKPPTTAKYINIIQMPLNHDEELTIIKPKRIKSESPHIYVVYEDDEHAKKSYLKRILGKPSIHMRQNVPYVELIMTDADDQTLRNTLAAYFDEKAARIRKGE